MELTVRDRPPYKIVDILGKVDRLKDSITLKSLLNTLVEQGTPRIGLNLSQVTYLDSGALNVFVYGRKIAKKAKGSFCLIEPNEYVMDVLEVVGLGKLITVHPTESDFDRRAAEAD